MKKAALFSAGIFVLCQFLSISVKAQQGKDGAGNITVANTVVNTVVTRLTANATAGNTSIKVNSTTGFAVGDLVFIIQMYGADINAYTDPNNFNNSLPLDTSYGKISNYNNVGYNEFAQVNAVPDGITLDLDCGIKNNYTATKKVQVIRVPRYTSLTITAPGSITCAAWNGTSGGVVVVEVQGNTVINAGASITASGMGYRGGVVKQSTGYGATNTGSWWRDNGAVKGESIVGDTTYYHNTFSGSLCKGNVANGGGGGDAMNCGGGGGSNGGVTSSWNGMGNPDNSTANNTTAWGLEPAVGVNGTARPTSSSGGGRGGYAFSSNNSATADPTVTGPNNGAVWGSDGRHNDGGWGGIPLDYSTGRIFMGGGGGAGDSNDGYGTAGGNGGGIVYLMSYGKVTGAGQLLADGSAANGTINTGAGFGNCAGIDGAGGGGGGGAVFLNSVQGFTLTNATPISAVGGKGGDIRTGCNFATTSQNYGPGGGGGGGYVGTSSAATSAVTGGANGIVVSGGGNSTRIATKFPPNGATSGGAGGTGTVTNFYLTTTNYTICAGSSASLSVTIGGTPPGGITVNWYSTSVGGSPIGTGNPFSTGPLALGTYTYYVGTCPGTYRDTVLVNVLAAPTVSVTATPTAVCAGQSATLTASGASSYTWSANAGGGSTNPTVVTPTVNTTYTVTGANGTCTNTQTVSVAITSAPSLTATATPTAVCSGQTATLTASGATSYTWSANAGGVFTATTVVTPTINTTYTVTGSNGSCSSTQTVQVVMASPPSLTVTAAPTAVCSGQTSTLTATGATSYTWSANAGGVFTATTVVTPTINTTYTVTGNSGGCVATQTVTVAISPAPTLTVTANPVSVCPGQTSTLTASGATSYTWSANAGGAMTATAVVTPTVNTTYTVTGDNGGCISTETVAVTMAAPPTLTITATPAAICNGGSSVLNASGASSYTWSANAGGGGATTVTVTPTVTTTYTLDGDNGGCISTQMITVVVNNGPTAADSAFTAAACGQANGSYTLNTVTGGAPNYQINFNNGGFTPIGSFPYSVSNLSAGIYPIVIQDNNGCTYTTSVNINNTGGITAVDSTKGDAMCNPANSGYIVLNSVTGGTGPFQVDVNGGGFTTIPSFPDSIKNLTAGSYTVTVKDASGCIHTTVFNVGSIGAITQVSTTVQNAVCVPANSGIIVLNSVTGGTSPFQVSVNGGALNPIASFPDSLKNLTAGSYTILVQDAAGCTNTSAINVGSQGGPSSASGTTMNDTCNRNVGSLTVSVVLGGTPAYQYSINGGALQSSSTFTALAAGTYTVLVQDNNGCTTTYTTSVGLTSIPSPTVTAQGPTTFCTGGSVVLSSSSATGNTWSTSASTQTISVNTAGTYAVSVTQNGCTANSNTIAVTVNPNPTVTVNSDSLCSGTSTTLTANGGLTYTWSPATGLSSANGSTVTASPGSTTVYTITAQDANGCPGVTTATVLVKPTPLPPTVNPDTLYYCLYQTATPLHVPSSGGSTVVWQQNGVTIADSTIVPPTNVLGVQVYNVMQGVGGCWSSLTAVTVIVVPGPNAAFTTNPSVTALPGQSVAFTPVQQSPVFVYSWDFDDPTSSSNSSTAVTPSHAYNISGTYCPQLIIVSLQTGCVDSSRLCLDVLNGITITIPNVFSPNQDHINDVFSIKTEGIRDLTCEIYDRWGLKLYSWNGLTGYWDGTTNGKQCSDGTYFYVVSYTDVKGVAGTEKGYVQLLK